MQVVQRKSYRILFTKYTFKFVEQTEAISTTMQHSAEYVKRVPGP